MSSLVAAVVASVALLAAVIWSGATHRRGPHYALVAGFFAALGLAVWRAKIVGDRLLFDGAAGKVHRVHDVVVGLCSGVALALLVTGVRLARAQGAAVVPRRRLHRVLANVFVLLFLVAAALGTTMTLLASPAP